MGVIRHYTLFLSGVMPMNAQNQTENLTIHHKVKDYAAWRKGYDDHEKSRHAAGVTNGRVFRSAEDPNDVLILQDVADMAKARTWLGGDELKAAMTKAGVIGSPNVRVVISRLAGRDKPCSAILPACSTNVGANGHVDECRWEPFASVCEASAIWRT
jgi:hypothetical protein